jgi:hypothetical protein
MPALKMFSKSIIDDSRSIIDESESIIDDSTRITDDFKVTLQLVASFMIIIYDAYIFIVHLSYDNHHA